MEKCPFDKQLKYKNNIFWLKPELIAEIQSAELTKDNNWTVMAFGVDKYVDGVEQEYFWKETNTPSGYQLVGNNIFDIRGAVASDTLHTDRRL